MNFVLYFLNSMENMVCERGYFRQIFNKNKSNLLTPNDHKVLIILSRHYHILYMGFSNIYGMYGLHKFLFIIMRTVVINYQNKHRHYLGQGHRRKYNLRWNIY